MMKMISEMVDGEHINTQFLVSNCAKCVNQSGAPYLNVDLKDSSGVINGKKWEIVYDDESIFAIGNIVKIEGDVLKYKENLQIKILSASKIDASNVDVTKFIKAPPVPKEELVQRFHAHINSIKNEDCKRVVEYLVNKFSSKIYDYPAAVSIHHDYASGLLMHTVTMADLVDYLAPIYNADRDVLMSGVLLHDLGKVIEFEGVAVFKYSLEGKLLGHLTIMSTEIKKAAEQLGITNEIPLLLQHMVLSHHGNLEYGAAVVPLTKEALLLSLIDNLDSKMVVINKALENVNPGEMTQRVFALDNRIFYNPKK